MKVVLEWMGKQPKTWMQAKVGLHYSARDNNFVKHRRDGEDAAKVYVFKDRKIGTLVLSQDEKKKWVEVGRIDVAGNVFLGGKDAMSYAEHSRTPEALEASRKFVDEWKKRGK